MSRKRDYIPYPERLAAALACLLPQEQRDDLRARKVTAREIESLVHWDHLDFHALGGSDLWYNLDPKLVAAHKEKTREDISIVAKVKRLSKSQEEFRQRILATEPREKPKSRWASRPFQSVKSRERMKKRR